MPDDAPADKQLVQWLRALADVVEGDPALAARVTRGMAELPSINAEVAPLQAAPMTPASLPPPVAADATAPEPVPTIAPTLRHTRKASRFGPSVAGRPAALGAGTPDPFAILAQEGEDGLRRALEALRVGTLRAIIRTHDLDPQAKLSANATEKRLVTAIITAVTRGYTSAPTKKTARRRSGAPPSP